MNQTSSQRNRASSATHSVLQKSSTLNRRYVKRPGALKSSDDAVAAAIEEQPVAIKINVNSKSAAEERRQKLVEEMKSEREQLVKKHRMKITVEQIDNDSGLEKAIAEKAEKVEKATVTKLQESPDVPAAPNPYRAALAQHRAAAEAEAVSFASAQELKNQAIAEALSAMTATPAEVGTIHSATKATRAEKKAAKQASKAANKAMAIADKQAKKQAKRAQKTLAEDDSALAKTFKKQKRRNAGAKFLLAFATSAACVAALGYFVHINMPDISVRVAAMQTGIEATYPSYIPRDYQLNSVATDQDNRVIMEFAGPENAKFKLTEEKSSWDSNALLNNFVKTNWGTNYTVVREQGITIYISTEADASWINGGLLYTLDSDGQLTKKQIKNIVTSL